VRITKTDTTLTDIDKCFGSGYDVPQGRGLSSGNESVLLAPAIHALKIRNGVIDKNFRMSASSTLTAAEVTRVRLFVPILSGVMG